MLVEILFVVGGLIVMGLGLAIAWSALSALLATPSPKRVTVPIEDPLRPHGR